MNYYVPGTDGEEDRYGVWPPEHYGREGRKDTEQSATGRQNSGTQYSLSRLSSKKSKASEF